MQYGGTTIDSNGVTVRLTGMRVDAGFFDLLGLKPLLGRFGTPEEDAAGRDRVLVLTQSFWEAHFGADRGVIGREVRLGGEPCTIIGVAPRAAEVLDVHTRFFTLFGAQPHEMHPMNARYLGKTTLFGRLKPRVSRDAGWSSCGGSTKVFSRSMRRRRCVRISNRRVIASRSNLWVQR